MSNPEGSDNTKPVVHEKDPHNYRKVGYSMIVIAVSLSVIGAVVWAIGDNWHFSTDIMANQEIDGMTPKHGYTIVYYDTAQPIGAKLKLLDSASTMDDALQKVQQYSATYDSNKAKLLIFNSTLTANQKLVHDTIDEITNLQAIKTSVPVSTAIANNTISSTNATKPGGNSIQSVASSPIVSQPTPITNQSNTVNPKINDTTSSTIKISNSTSPVKPNSTNNTQSNSTSPVKPNSQKSLSLSESVGIRTQ